MQPEEIPTTCRCCLNCKWHDLRTGFCRFNPPTAMQAFVKGLGTVNQSIWPKPPLPELDWCSKFENRYDKKVI